MTSFQIVEHKLLEVFSVEHPLEVFFDMLSATICPDAVCMWDKDLRSHWSLKDAELHLYPPENPWRIEKGIHHVVFYKHSGQRAWVKDHWEYVDVHGESA